MYAFAGKVYSGGTLRGFVRGNSMTEVKRQASMLCNRYYHAIDEMELHRYKNKEDGNIMFTRLNKKSPDNSIIRGKWR